MTEIINKTVKKIGNSTVITLTKEVTMGKKLKKDAKCEVTSKLKKDHIVVVAKIYFDTDEKNKG